MSTEEKKTVGFIYSVQLLVIARFDMPTFHINSDRCWTRNTTCFTSNSYLHFAMVLKTCVQNCLVCKAKNQFDLRQLQRIPFGFISINAKRRSKLICNSILFLLGFHFVSFCFCFSGANETDVIYHKIQNEKLFNVFTKRRIYIYIFQSHLLFAQYFYNCTFHIFRVTLKKKKKFHGII